MGSTGAHGGILRAKCTVTGANPIAVWAKCSITLRRSAIAMRMSAIIVRIFAVAIRNSHTVARNPVFPYHQRNGVGILPVSRLMETGSGKRN